MSPEASRPMAVLDDNTGELRSFFLEDKFCTLAARLCIVGLTPPAGTVHPQGAFEVGYERILSFVFCRRGGEEEQGGLCGSVFVMATEIGPVARSRKLQHRAKGRQSNGGVANSRLSGMRYVDVMSSARRERADVSVTKRAREKLGGRKGGDRERGREGESGMVHAQPLGTAFPSKPNCWRWAEPSVSSASLSVHVVHDRDTTRNEVLTNQLNYVSTIFLACARCHHRGQTARIVPGISGVPEELRNLGVGPMLYSMLLRSPGLSDALVEMAGKIGLSSVLKGK